MALILVWQFENWPDWVLEQVRERSPGWILSLPAWTTAWTVVSPDEVEGGENRSQFRRKMMRHQVGLWSCWVTVQLWSYRTSYCYFMPNILKTKLIFGFFFFRFYLLFYIYLYLFFPSVPVSLSMAPPSQSFKAKIFGTIYDSSFFPLPISSE